jgi:hypothetical protein
VCDHPSEEVTNYYKNTEKNMKKYIKMIEENNPYSLDLEKKTHMSEVSKSGFPMEE